MWGEEDRASAREIRRGRRERWSENREREKKEVKLERQRYR